MVKTSVRERARQLLLQGISKTKVAETLGVARQTIIRWSREPDFADINSTSEQLEQNANSQVATFKATLTVKERIDNLMEYCQSQRQLAVMTQDTALSLLPVCQNLIAQLQENPEVSPRLIPQFIRAVAELSRVSSDCHTRAMGAETRIRDELVSEVESRKQALLLVRSPDAKVLEDLIFAHYPITQQEIEEESKQSIISDDPVEIAREYRRLIEEYCD